MFLKSRRLHWKTYFNMQRIKAREWTLKSLSALLYLSCLIRTWARELTRWEDTNLKAGVEEEAVASVEDVEVDLVVEEEAVEEEETVVEEEGLEILMLLCLSAI